MDDATEELYLQKIEEFVHDDDVIVNVEYLCRKLDIAIKDAKRLIAKYLTDHRNVKPEELGVHYVVLGKLREEDKFCVILVAETDLNDKLPLFKSGYSKEIYSIQKARRSDINALNLINTEPREKALLGSIISKNCVVNKKLINKPVKVETIKRKLEPVKPEISAEKKLKLDENMIEKKASPTKTKIANRPVRNGKGIASFFSKMAEKPKAPDKKPPIEQKSKVNVSEEKIDSPKEKNQGIKEAKPLIKLIDTDDESDDVKMGETPQKDAVSKSKKKAPNSPKKVDKKRPRKRDEVPEKSQKRRKRVIEPQSDSEDDIFVKSDNEDTDLQSSSHDETSQEPVVKPPKFDPFAPKNKQKKLVDKSYVDDEGYMVTKKEWVAISGSGDEEPEKEQKIPDVPSRQPLSKKIETKPTKKLQVNDKKELPPTAVKGKGKNAKKVTNQPSILSFFNKK